ncbi:MAG: ferrous iron transport protein B [Flavobacterium sp.]|nr:ferrous iron transport protein B [Flavobacterium sp.]
MQSIQVALIGNPNTGKTSVFNQLTGLKQQVGNYPGITVEKKVGQCMLSETCLANVLDLPGTYSLNASSIDENVVIEVLLNKKDPNFPDVIAVITDVENLKRNLLLFTQIKDLELPTVLVINMADRMVPKGISMDIPYLEAQLQTKIVLVSSRKRTGIAELKNVLANYQQLSVSPCLNASSIDEAYFSQLRKTFPNQLLYKLWLVITQDVNFLNLERKEFPNSFTKSHADLKRLQQKETIKRYQFINDILKKGLLVNTSLASDYRSKLDRILMHPFWGYVIFFGVLFLIFQSIFDWSRVPMNWIDTAFANLSTFTSTQLQPGMLNDLLSQGIIPGIGGILLFIPQIAFLFLFISLLEESGYMSRVVFLMDKIMRRYGLSGKSVVPLISGTACAIPAIMATRNIESWKERLLVILVTPFVTCSARLPVYAIIIAVVIPDTYLLGVVHLQGLVFLFLYILGFASAIISAWLLNKVLRISNKTYFVVEMPNYKVPLFKNVYINVIEKTKAFLFGAGKIILALSIILWFLASFGPGEDFKNAEANVVVQHQNLTVNSSAYKNALATYKLENSYIGLMGKSIEPIISPLGYDWKIGIAIISSFAAREVFVGTLATIYSVGESESNSTIVSKMKADKDIRTGIHTFRFSSGVSLLLFYVFAMQCISTLAITRKETNSYYWPLAQLVFMTGLAYLVAFLTYQFLN